MKYIVATIIALAAFMLGGCIRQSYKIAIAPDGSGEIEVRHSTIILDRDINKEPARFPASRPFSEISIDQIRRLEATCSESEVRKQLTQFGVTPRKLSAKLVENWFEISLEGRAARMDAWTAYCATRFAVEARDRQQYSDLDLKLPICIEFIRIPDSTEVVVAVFLPIRNIASPQLGPALSSIREKLANGEEIPKAWLDELQTESAMRHEFSLDLKLPGAVVATNSFVLDKNDPCHLQFSTRPKELTLEQLPRYLELIDAPLWARIRPAPEFKIPLVDNSKFWPPDPSWMISATTGAESRPASREAESNHPNPESQPARKGSDTRPKK